MDAACTSQGGYKTGCRSCIFKTTGYKFMGATNWKTFIRKGFFKFNSKFNENPLGKTIEVNIAYGKNDFTTTGVIDESLGKSHIHENSKERNNYFMVCSLNEKKMLYCFKVGLSVLYLPARKY